MKKHPAYIVSVSAMIIQNIVFEAIKIPHKWGSMDDGCWLSILFGASDSLSWEYIVEGV